MEEGVVKNPEKIMTSFMDGPVKMLKTPTLQTVPIGI